MAQPEELQNLVTRAPKQEVRALKEWARMYGRTLDEEVRLAYRLHLHGHASSLLRETRAEDGSNLEQELQAALVRLEELTSSAYTRQAPTAGVLATVREFALTD